MKGPAILSSIVLLALTIAATGCRNEDSQRGKDPASSTTANTTPIVRTTDHIDPGVESAMTRLNRLDWAEKFDRINSTVAYEPYAGIQRGSEWTFRMQRGNSLDQAVLLASALEADVAAYRFVSGKLDPALASRLVATIPGRVPVDIGPSDLELYSSAGDDALQKRLEDHYWLEVKLDDESDWLALDPAVPGAAPGETFATARRRFNAPGQSLHQRIRADVMMKVGDSSRRVGSVNGTVADLAFSSFAVSMKGVPLYETIDETEVAEADNNPSGGNPFGGLFGGGAPADDKKESDEEQAVKETGPAIGTTVTFDVLAGGSKSAGRPHKILIADPSTFIDRVWVDFTLTIPGERQQTFERALFESNEDNAVRGPLGVHRYDVTVLSGPVSTANFESMRSSLGQHVDVEDWNALLETSMGESAGNSELEKASIVESESGNVLGQLLALAFAHESDSITTGLARRGGVSVLYSKPRILISSVETRPIDDVVVSEINLDLRLDQVDAVPYEGMPAGSASLFQRARGMQEASLEGEVLETVLGADVDVITTVDVMRVSQENSIPMTVLTPLDAAMVSSVQGLDRRDAERIRASLDEGNNVIIPARSVEIDGLDTIGWWLVEKSSGAFVGVMSGGEHQAMAQYQTTSLNRILSPSQGFMLGMLNGAVGTHVLLAAGMLKYGQYTQQLKEEVRAQLQYLNCVMCPDAKIEVSAGSTVGVSAKVGSCYEFEILENRDLSYGKSASLPFCSWYKKGVSCAASLILDGLKVTVETEEAEGPSIDITVPYNC
ncbi:MAG: transglutaminase family protein [Rhodothermales bacterium]|nr:transglutaminase family protein [Rhodothermales bacterium]